MKSSYLARSPRKQNITPLLQKTFSISKPCFYACLKIFASHHRTNPIQCFGISNPYLPILIIDSPKYHTSIHDYLT